jgi:hypothetical protein
MGRARGRGGLAGVIGAALLAGAGPAAAAVRVHLLVIGNNNAFGDGSDASAARPLRFADDDAAAFYRLLAETAHSSHLLTVMDADTQKAYPALAPVARPPTVATLRAAVTELAWTLDDGRARGDTNVLHVFFSGHGSIGGGKEPALALLDGGISRQLLYDEILARLPADYVHLFVDACHAEAVVRPRDTQAATVPIKVADADAFVTRSTLARFPHVGAIVAASSDSRAHEWDQLGHGVFTHELLSALRGAADVNRDGKIEYSEIYAFLGAANRGVENARARLRVVARPPEIDRHVAVLDLTRFPTGKSARLVGVPPQAGLVELEDGAGRRLASLRAEVGFVADLIVPAGTIYVRARDKEARFEGRAGETVSFGSLSFRDPRQRSRGALEDAVSRGLFAGEFGRAYYNGFIDQAPDFVSVTFAATDAVRVQATPVHPSALRPPSTSWRIVAGLGASPTVARAFDASPVVRFGLRSATWRGPTLSVDLARAAEGEIAESRAVITGGWSWSAAVGPAHAWIGASLGGGMIAQGTSGADTRWSGVFQAGPSTGVAANVTGRVGLWGEAQLAAAAYRQDGKTALAWAPAAFGGVSVGF